MPFSDEVLARLMPDADADHQQVPAAEVGAAAAAAPGPVGGRLRLRRRDRVLRREVRADRGRGHRGVVTFYTMYKRQPVGRVPRGRVHQHAVRDHGRRPDLRRAREHLGVGNDETTPDGKVALEHLECNAACDYAPVVMVNWEFFDNHDPGTRPGSSSTTCGPGTRSARPAARAGCAPGARRPGSSPASATARPPRARRPGRPAWSASSSPRSTAGPRPNRTTLPGTPIRTPERAARPDPGQPGPGSPTPTPPTPGPALARQGVAVTDTLTPVLTAHWDQPDSFTLDGYKRGGG